MQKITGIVNELSKIDINDLKSINYNKLLQNVLKRTDSLAQSVVIVISIILLLFLIVSSNNQTKSLRANIASLKEKTQSVASLDNSKKELAQYLSTLPDPITGEKLISILNDIAVASRVQVLSFSPAIQNKTELSELINMRLDISGAAYKDIWQFIYNLETSKHPIRVNSWVGVPEAPYPQDPMAGEPNFKATIEISLTNIIKKND